jgi:hypothetical protein
LSVLRRADRRGARSLALIVVAALVPLMIYSLVTTFVSLRNKRNALEQNALALTRRISAIVDAELAG